MKCLKCGMGELIVTKKDGKNIAKCEKCGSVFSADDIRGQIQMKAAAAKETERERGGGGMGIWRLVSGILSIALCLLVALQSCAAGLGNALSQNGEVGGSAGIIVAIMLLAGGIVSIVTRNGATGGSIATAVLYGLGALVGFLLAGGYSDLYIWAGWCLICAVTAVVSIFI